MAVHCICAGCEQKPGRKQHGCGKPQHGRSTTNAWERIKNRLLLHTGFLRGNKPPHFITHFYYTSTTKNMQGIYPVPRGTAYSKNTLSSSQRSQFQKSVTFETGFQKPHSITVFEVNLEGVSKLVRLLKLPPWGKKFSKKMPENCAKMYFLQE